MATKESGFLFKVKYFFISTFLYKYFLMLIDVKNIFFLSFYGFKNRDVTTTFCVSPYKSGTTYLAGLYEKHNLTLHEPMQFSTITRLDDSLFMSRRCKFLSLDLECSGFYSGNLERTRKQFPNSKFIFIYRPLIDWIDSFVNYFINLDSRVSYNYLEDLYFSKFFSYRVSDFQILSDIEKKILINELIIYWYNCYSFGLNDNKSIIIPLDGIEENIQLIDSFTNLKSSTSHKPWKRAGVKNNSIVIKKYVDPVLAKNLEFEILSSI